MTQTLLFTPQSLHDARHRVVPIDVRNQPDVFLPNALCAPLSKCFCGQGAPGIGRNPWRPSADVRRTLGALGVTPDDTLVFYDEGGMGTAARCWYAAEKASFPKVALLEGGIAAWQTAGFETTPLAAQRPAQTLSPLASQPGGVFSFTDAFALWEAGSHVFLDARPLDRWTGANEPVDARPGHIPGSISLPASMFVVNGRLRPVEEIREIFRKALSGDPRPVVHYCGSGIAASLTLFAARLADVPAAGLYPGSWSEWCVRTPIGEKASDHEA